MIVVSDTTPIISLLKVHQIDLLQKSGRFISDGLYKMLMETIEE